MPGYLRRVYAPINRGLQSISEVGKEATSLVGNVFGRSVTGVRRAGRSVTGRLNQGLGELVGKSRKGGARKTRRRGKKSRKASRKNRH